MKIESDAIMELVRVLSPMNEQERRTAIGITTEILYGRDAMKKQIVELRDPSKTPAVVEDMSIHMQRTLLSANEAATKYGKSTATVYNYVKHGTITKKKINGHMHVYDDELVNILGWKPKAKKK